MNRHHHQYPVSTLAAVADCDYLAEMHSLFMELVVSTGYSPTQWQRGLSVMLEKVAGCRDPE